MSVAQKAWGRLFDPVDKSSTQWIAIHRMKKRCAMHG